MTNQVINQSISNNANPSSASIMVHDGSYFNMREFRKFSTLPETAWKYLDSVLIRTAKEELNGIIDLNSRESTNVTFDGRTASVYTRERISEVGNATISVSPDTSGDSAIVAMDTCGVPMLVTYKDFTLDTSAMKRAERIGIPLQTTLVEEATRSVSRAVENTLFNGEIEGNGATAYGYTRYPYRGVTTISDWSLIATTPDTILSDVNNMITISLAANHYGPWILYIPWQYYSRLNEDYTIGSTPVSTNRSILTRLKELPMLEDVKVTKFLENNNVVLVEMSSSTVQMINGMPMRVVEWEAPGVPYWNRKFKVLTMMIPFIISDYKGQCGVIHGSV